MKKITLMFTMFLTAQIAYASPAKEESIQQLLEITHTKQLVDSVQTQFQPMFNNIIEKSVPQGPNRNIEITTAKKKLPAIQEMMKEELSYEKLKPEYIKIYQDTFSEEEIQGMITFYETPVGQSVINKMPIVMQKSMGIMQTKIQALLPKITSLLVKN